MSSYLPRVLPGDISDLQHREGGPTHTVAGNLTAREIRIQGGRAHWVSAMHCNEQEGSMRNKRSKNLQVHQKNDKGMN